MTLAGARLHAALGAADTLRRAQKYTLKKLAAATLHVTAMHRGEASSTASFCSCSSEWQRFASIKRRNYDQTLLPSHQPRQNPIRQFYFSKHFDKLWV